MMGDNTKVKKVQNKTYKAQTSELIYKCHTNVTNHKKTVKFNRIIIY